MFLMTSIIWSCSQSGEKESSGNKQGSKEQAQSPSKPAQSPQLQTKQPVKAQPSGEVDAYGRKPGEQHYGHNHSSSEPHQQPANSTNTKPATPVGGPDSRGRKPGDQHYGHNHD